MAHTYNPGEIVSYFAGVSLLDEPGEETLISIERDEEAITKTMSVKGRAIRNINLNRSARVLVTCMYTSHTNAILSAILKADLAAGNGSGIAPLSIKDRLSAAELHFAGSAWIAVEPDFEWAKEVGEIEWAIDCERLESFFAGR